LSYKHGFIYIYDLLLEERFLLDLLPPLDPDPPNLAGFPPWSLDPPRLDLLRLDFPPVFAAEKLDNSGKIDDILVYTINILKKTK
jgi:hypothetical protein